GNLAKVDLDVALMRQLGYELLHGFDRHNCIMIALQDKTRRRARREEGEIIDVGRRRDRDETLDFGPSHQQLHADPCAEWKSGDPTRSGVGIVCLQPIERGGGIGKLAFAPIEAALTPPDTAEVETQSRETAAHKALI